MSGYTDDPREYDRYDPDRRDGEPNRRDEDDVRRARARVSVPAVGLIVVGALTIFLTVSALVQLQMGLLDRPFDDAIQQVQADPNRPAAQKQEMIQLIDDIRIFIKTYGPVYWGVGAVAGVVLILGGLRLKALSNPGLVVFSSLLAVLPFSACCVLGVVFGIWAMVALANPDVKAGFAAKQRLASAPPDPY